MKKLLTVLAVLSFVGGLASQVSANEGTLAMTGQEVACEGVSLWKGSNFRVTGRCDGLVYPYATQQDRYVLWAKTESRGELVRVSEVDRGYFDGNVAEKFGDLYLTAESQGLPRKPSDTQIASGVVSAFGFAKGEAAVATPAPLAQEENTESMTVQNGASTVAAGTTAASVIGKILRSLLVIIGVVIVLVIGTSLIFRRRGSISS